MTTETQDYALQRRRIAALESEVTRLQSLLVELYCGGPRATRAARREIQRLGVELPRVGVNLTCAERARVADRGLRAWGREVTG